MQRRKFSREFKLEAVKLVRERGVSVSQAARDLDLHENVLRKWVREQQADPGSAFPGVMKPEQQEIERLRRELARMKAERDILKKAAVGSTGHRNMTGFVMLKEASEWRAPGGLVCHQSRDVSCGLVGRRGNR